MWVAGIKYIVLAIIPFIILPGLSNMGIGGGGSSIFLWVYLIALWLGFFIELTDFLLDSWILTNERLIDIEQLSMFSRRVSTLALDRVQDITVEESGIINTFLGIGTVYIQTAGQEREFKIPGAKYPSKVKELIVNAYQQERNTIIDRIKSLN